MKKNMVIASIIAAKSAKTSVPYLEQASHKCNQCGHKFSTQATIASPFCVSCGGDTTRIQGVKSQDLSKVNTDSLTDVVCASCSAHNIMHSETASVMGGKFCCVACGVPLTYQVESSDDGDDDDDMLSNTGTGVETSDDDIPSSYDEDDDVLSGEDDDESDDEMDDDESDDETVDFRL
jgi:transposase-like protein